jgi:hypothetical protein
MGIMKLLRSTAVCLVAPIATLVALAPPASASAITGTAHCGDIYSTSQTQKVNVCVYFEWGAYVGGMPYYYHVVGSMASYSSAGNSKLTIRTLRVQQQGVSGAWTDVGTTNPSYPVVGYYSVSETMYDRTRVDGSENACWPIRAVIDYRIDFISGAGYKQGTLTGPGWSGYCF